MASGCSPDCLSKLLFAGAFGGFPIKGKPQSSTAPWLWGQRFLTNPLISPPQLLSPFSNGQQHKEEQTSKSSLWDIFLLAFCAPWEHARSLLGQRGRVRINEDNLSQDRSWRSYFHFPSPGAVAQCPCCTEGMSDCHHGTWEVHTEPEATARQSCWLSAPCRYPRRAGELPACRTRGCQLLEGLNSRVQSPGMAQSSTSAHGASSGQCSTCGNILSRTFCFRTQGPDIPKPHQAMPPQALGGICSQDTFSGFLHAPPAFATMQQVLFGDETS